MSGLLKPEWASTPSASLTALARIMGVNSPATLAGEYLNFQRGHMCFVGWRPDTTGPLNNSNWPKLNIAAPWVAGTSLAEGEANNLQEI
jgi:hypothetical protein